VNQKRVVVEQIIEAGRPYGYGLEAGSKPELLPPKEMVALFSTSYGAVVTYFFTKKSADNPG
jgi:arginine decarboxylase-like protein